MTLVDLNILLYAINPSSAHYGTVHPWWEAAMGSDEPVGLTWIVLSGFLRLATNSRVFPNPMSVESAVGRVARWLSHPNTRLVQETEGHWSIFRTLLEEAGTAGNLTTDAHLATLAISTGATLVSCDHDFTRFAGLRLLNPLHP